VISLTAHPLASLDSPIHGLDPRYRLVCAFVASIWIVAMPRTAPVLAALAGAAALALVARVPARMLAGRLIALNAFMLLALVSLPFSIPGEPVASIGALSASAAGLERAFHLLLTGNALALLLTALVATIEPVTLGHALMHLRVPAKLVHILMFAIRYADVLHQSRLRLTRAMRARAFVPRADAHGLRSTAHLVAALVAESFARAQRVEQAMKCRGWRGRFHVLNHFRAGPRDICFAAVFLGVLAAIGGLL
jgi:cobalt/nickel transport system permease protein